MNASLCDAISFKCIMGRCKDCKSFSKIENLKAENLKCSKDCIKKGCNCATHTVKVRQFERVIYMHKGKEKKKIALVDKYLTIDEVIDLLKSRLSDFFRHRFNVQHTAEIYDELVSSLDENTIIKIHDFSENYMCLLPDEIQSLHWTQETATVYPVVVLRRVNGDVREDHITFISNDTNHNVPFVELCNNWLHKDYQDQGVEIVHDVEYNDGCSSQFKCIRARRNIRTTRIFCENHGKSKSDGLGGVIKCYVSRSVCSEKSVIQDGKELYKFFQERLLVRDAFDSPKLMLNRLFHYISTEEMDDYWSTFPANTFQYIPGTLKIHEVVTSPGDETHIRFRNILCACVNCLSGNYATCKRKEVFKDVVDMITLQKHVFTSAGKRKQKQNDDDID